MATSDRFFAKANKAHVIKYPIKDAVHAHLPGPNDLLSSSIVEDQAQRRDETN